MSKVQSFLTSVYKITIFTNSSRERDYLGQDVLLGPGEGLDEGRGDDLVLDRARVAASLDLLLCGEQRLLVAQQPLSSHLQPV